MEAVSVPERRETLDTALDMHHRVTARELEHVMRLQPEALAGNPALAKALPPMMVWGRRGWGGQQGRFKGGRREEGSGSWENRKNRPPGLYQNSEEGYNKGKSATKRGATR